MVAFDGFSQAGLEFLGELGSHDKVWFDANRSTYDRHVVPAAKAFVTALGSWLGEHVSPGIEAQPRTNGSIAPINNDLRFNPDASPYKDHLMFRFWEGPVKKTSAMLMVRLHPSDGVGFASGMNFADLDTWRTTVAADESGRPLAAAIRQVVDETGAEVVGQALKNVPKPHAVDHPRGDLLRHKGLQVRFIDHPPPSTMVDAGFVDWCGDRLARFADLHHLLVANLT